jgi:hypothetical protein
MPTRYKAQSSVRMPARVRAAAARWLLLVHQLPASPSNLRVRTWRRLQQLGAIAVKQAVYVLPDSPGAREDFEWLKTEIEGAGGQASVFAAATVDAWSDDALVEEFRRSRQDSYAELAKNIETAIKTIDLPRRRRKRAPAVEKLLEIFRGRLADVERIDFFGSAGRDRVIALLAQLEARISQAGGRVTNLPANPSRDPLAYRRRLWVTRPRPGVDRMSSAWLIRRFIDAESRFGFVADREAAPHDSIPFDMFGVEFTHEGDHCTFETLCGVFGIDDPGIRRVAAIVHDLDLKDERFRPAEAPALGLIIDGLQLAYADDESLLQQGMVLFEALYRAAERSARPPGPRMVANKRGGPEGRTKRSRPKRR